MTESRLTITGEDGGERVEWCLNATEPSSMWDKRDFSRGGQVVCRVEWSTDNSMHNPWPLSEALPILHLYEAAPRAIVNTALMLRYL